MGESSTSQDHADASHLVLEPDTIHEQDGGLYIDCPACGSPTPLTQIIEDGHCSGYVDDEMSETGETDRPVDGVCQASLSVELVWEE